VSDTCLVDVHLTGHSEPDGGDLTGIDTSVDGVHADVRLVRRLAHRHKRPGNLLVSAHKY
jgi:hypothetical protein